MTDKKNSKVEFDARVGAPVDPETGQVNPDQAPPDQTPEFDGNYTGWHRDGQPVAPFPAPDGGVDFKTDHFQAATVAGELSDRELAAVQRVNKGDAGLDDPATITADALRRADTDALKASDDVDDKRLADMTKAGEKRREEQRKVAAEKQAADPSTPTV